MSVDGDHTEEDLEGLSIDAAVDAVVADGDDRDPQAVRSALGHVTADGVVSREAADGALDRAAEMIFTPETRAELAAVDLADARERAAPVEDVDAVQTRLAALETRVDAVEERADALGPALEDLLDRDPETADLYDLGVAVQSLTEAANGVHRDADQLRFDIEDFEEWLGDPETRYSELNGDVDAVASSLDELRAVPASLSKADGRAVAGDHAGEDARAVTWANATLRHRTLGLMLADLRAELGDLRTLDDHEQTAGGDDAASGDRIDARLDDLGTRLDAIGDELDDVADPAWRDRYADDVDAFEAELDRFEPPVDWGAIRAALREHSLDAA
ncbi:MAG: halo transducer protein [Haloarculaceae archaeon]